MTNSRLTVLPALALWLLCALPASAADLTVMTFNIWGGGANAGKSIAETVAAIRAVNPDIIGIQETRIEGEICTADDCPPQGESVAGAIAEALGYHYVDQSQTNVALWANAILSRYPIGSLTPNGLGAPISVDGKTVWAFNIHLDDSPYQPYQALKIPYGDAPFLNTEADLVAAAAATRGPALDLLETDLALADSGDLTLIFGDFNEPSELDWTDATVSAGLQPLAVAYPTTHRIAALGFTDLFRVAFPDPVAKPGMTWTPTSAADDPEDHHDRIDFTFGRGAQLKVVAAGIVGERQPEADVVVTPWPSDHRASFARLTF